MQFGIIYILFICLNKPKRFGNEYFKYIVEQFYFNLLRYCRQALLL